MDFCLESTKIEYSQLSNTQAIILHVTDAPFTYLYSNFRTFFLGT